MTGIGRRRRQGFSALVDALRITDAQCFSNCADDGNHIAQIGRHKDLGRSAVGDILKGVDAAQPQHALLDVGLGQVFQTGGLGFVSEADGLRFALGYGDPRLHLCFRRQDLGRLVALGPLHDGFLMSLRLQYGLTLLTLRLHLLGHGFFDVPWRVDVLDLDTGHLEAPGVGRRVQDGLHLGVDLLS